MDICLLGASGSVGESTLKVLRQFPDAFRLHSCSVHSNEDKAKAIIDEFSPQVLVVTSKKAKRTLGTRYKNSKIYYGEEALLDIVSATEVDIVVTAIVGSAGIFPTTKAIESGKKIAIANKETLVTFGPYINGLLQKHPVAMIPVDSEHNALFQLLEDRQGIDTLVLTASGGTFRDLPLEKFKDITLEQALKHPTWSMGPKITIDSAGMVNKGLEVIEAHFLFGFPYEKIEVVIHPESIVHGIVALQDGASLLYASHPDMIFPIAHSLFYPEKVPALLLERKAHTWGALHFRSPEAARYPALPLAYAAGKRSGTAPAIFNAANEEAVSQFIAGNIQFVHIPQLIDASLQGLEISDSPDLQGYLEADQNARQFVADRVKKGML